MIRLSWSTLRERWQLFVGAFVAVAVGVALVQASLLTLLAAADPRIPPGLNGHEVLVIRSAYTGAVSLAAIVMVITIFVAVFVVGSTFAFTVAQRRRDLALLRLIGATPRQVSRLLLGETLLLGALGVVAGILLGLLLTGVETTMFARFGFAPDGFAASWHWWVIAVSTCAGLAIAVLGCLAASRRAGKVRALDALRQAGSVDRVMTPGRWVVGLGAVAGTLAFGGAAAASQGSRAMDAAIPACLLAVLALTLLAPVVVPFLGTVFDRTSAVLFPGSRLGELVHANLRTGVRRTASTAAPIILLVGLVVGLAGTVEVIDTGRRVELERTLRGDLVVASTQPIGDRLATVPGVRSVAEETPVLVEVPESDPDRGTSYSTTEALAVDGRYATTHSLDGGSDVLQDMVGDTIAFDDAYASALQAQVGDVLPVRIDGRVRDLRVAAVVPETMTGSDVILPVGLVPVGSIERSFFVEASSQEDVDAVAARVEQNLPEAASVLGIRAWSETHLAERREVSQNLILAILGLVTLYIAIAVVNAVVIAAGDRREEFAVARLTGLTRRQVMAASLWESLEVAGIGVLLGSAAAAVTLVGVMAGVSDVVGATVVSVPWLLVVATVLGAVLVVAATSLLASAAATRPSPISVAAARE